MGLLSHCCGSTIVFTALEMPVNFHLTRFVCQINQPLTLFLMQDQTNKTILRLKPYI